MFRPVLVTLVVISKIFGLTFLQFYKIIYSSVL